MGRKAHLARMALGRSPFDAPLQDEDGEFILGPNVQHATARNYVQRFDSRGHPENLASEASRRRLRRAQNEVLSTVGVVVRKAKMNRSRWESMGDDQKHLLLLDENIAGANIGIVESVVLKMSTRWLSALRRRILVFKSYVGLSVPRILRTEWNVVGPWSVLFAGLPFGAVSAVSQALRDDILDEHRFTNLLRSSSTSPAIKFANLIGSHRLDFLKLLCSSLIVSSLRMLWFAAEYPLYAFSTLQSLYLIPAGAFPHPWSFVPFSNISPIQLPRPLPDGSLTSVVIYVTRLCAHPFTIAYVRDQIGKFIYTKLYILARHLVVKPDRPDRISLQSARANSSVFNDTTIPGLGADGKALSSHNEPSPFTETIKTLFPALFWLWEKILQTQSASLTVELTPDMQEELVQRSMMYYRDSIRRQRRDYGATRHSSRTLRVMAIRDAFADFGLDPDQAMVDIFELAEGLHVSARDDASTATPEPEADILTSPMVIVAEADGALHVQPARTADASQLESQHSPGDRSPENLQEANGADATRTDIVEGISEMPTLDERTVPLERLLLTAPSDRLAIHVDEPIDAQLFPSPPPSSPPSPPELGINRAQSLIATAPRPVRRETDIYNEQARPIRQDLFSRHHSLRAQEEDDGVYRVTILSNHPAEAFALNVASAIEPLLLLPLDILFFRSMVRNFTTQPTSYGLSLSTGSLLTRTLPVVFNFGADEYNGSSAMLPILGNWVITLATQSIINFTIWKMTTHLILRLGRRFGWGKI
ncbi:hypothetical protein PV08_04665 [Exophiala spinifera]|uniref:Uncharacterized protein n=1 Tax=Exophiala spinifera TaxID=91928 RepID=A0A0D1YQH2_9EURO|nr:uncharacterized protein PV08_04665 [Exophiala spinifera]KIW17471.1 hypothetical protein PV08_04665 [Exophiala spinifera]